MEPFALNLKHQRRQAKGESVPPHEDHVSCVCGIKEAEGATGGKAGISLQVSP